MLRPSQPQTRIIVHHELVYKVSQKGTSCDRQTILGMTVYLIYYNAMTDGQCTVTLAAEQLIKHEIRTNRL